MWKDSSRECYVAGNPAEIIKELDPKEKQVSRAEMFSSPKALDELYLEIDRISLKKTLFING